MKALFFFVLHIFIIKSISADLIKGVKKKIRQSSKGTGERPYKYGKFKHGSLNN